MLTCLRNVAGLALSREVVSIGPPVLVKLKRIDVFGLHLVMHSFYYYRSLNMKMSKEADGDLEIQMESPDDSALYGG